MGLVRVYGSTLRRPWQQRSRRFESIRHFCVASKAQIVPRSDGSIDVLCLGNLCVDVVQEVDVLPAHDVQSRKQLLSQLTQEPPPKDAWKVGGSTNFMIAAARLGLTVWSCGHVADDGFGRFLLQVLQDEGISEHLTLTENLHDEILRTTLVCFVLVEASTRSHAFCSRYDFGPWPLLSKFSPQQIGSNVSHAFMNTRAVMMNGFVFDELSLEVVRSLATSSQESGASVFFDPVKHSGYTRHLHYDTLASLNKPAHAVSFTCGVHRKIEYLGNNTRLAHANCSVLAPYLLQRQLPSLLVSPVYYPGPRSFTFTAGPRQHALQAVLRVATVVMVTEGELQVLLLLLLRECGRGSTREMLDSTEIAITGEPDSRLGSRQLLYEYSRNMKWVIVKYGSRGSMLVHVCPTTQDVVYTEQDSFSVEVVDTVGCGDSFAAAVVLGYLNQWPHDMVLLLANAMGAATATHEGAGQNVGKLHEVLDLLKSAVRHSASVRSTQQDEWQTACREALMMLKALHEEPESSQDFLEV